MCQSRHTTRNTGRGSPRAWTFETRIAWIQASSIVFSGKESWATSPTRRHRTAARIQNPGVRSRNDGGGELPGCATKMCIHAKTEPRQSRLLMPLGRVLKKELAGESGLPPKIETLA